jgi:hypothetical protein
MDTNDFLVTGGEVVLAASGVDGCQGGDTRQPIYERSLRRGRWRVLRTIDNHYPPRLAAHGQLLAIGAEIPVNDGRLLLMRVRLIDLRDGRLRAQFTLPDGNLQFAGPDRLVLSTPAAPGFAYASGGLPSRMFLYSAGGRLLAELGRTARPPLVSGDHLVTVDESRDYQTETVSVRRLPYGAPRPVIGFRSPARKLVALAFRWPRLALIQTTSPLFPPDQPGYQCSPYGPASQPSETTLDLAGGQPSIPPPPPPPPPTTSNGSTPCVEVP